MEPEEGILDKFGRSPFSSFLGVRAFDVAVDFTDAEANVVPVCMHFQRDD